ncbi:MAG TPA: hypothetical protein VKE22_14535 [Haliangiales bacterium]|nr:hypothetical protein [Haliangiales bacterium]
MVALATPITPISVSLPRNAADCYRLFCDIGRTPDWLRVVRSAMVTERDAEGRPRRVAFLARLRRATIGYTLHYRYRARDLRVAWGTPIRSKIRVHGFAQFAPLGDASCLMTYGLELDKRGLPPWGDSHFEAHAPSAVAADFRDFVLRQ